MCPRHKQTRDKGFMSFQLFKKIVDEAKSWASLIDLDFYGEILLHPEFDRLIKYAKSKGLKTAVSTNVTLLNSENSKKLIDSGLDLITLSLDSINKESFEAIRKGANFENCINNIKTFLSLNKGRIFTVVQMIYMKDNQGGAWEYLSYWSKYKQVNVRIKPYFDFDLAKTRLRVDSPEIVSQRPCFYPWECFVITWDGKVVPCCNDYDKRVVLGDVNKNSIREIWNNRKMKTLRKTHIEMKKQAIPLCRTCKVPETSNTLLFLSSFIDAFNRKRLSPILEKELLLNKKGYLGIHKRTTTSLETSTNL
jgi:radical SAM protein with 4Fe4S-binding SPASM domain